MPYLDPEDREEWDAWLDQIPGLPKTKGELNYLVSRLGIMFLAYQSSHPNYDERSNVIAALTDAAAEMRRRIMDPYEDEKIESNGDLSFPELAPQMITDGKIQTAVIKAKKKRNNEW
jgi:hypothetical protein